MCELLGISANVPTDIYFSFTGLYTVRRRYRATQRWLGITFYEGNGFRAFVRRIAARSRWKIPPLLP
ncbi:MAG: class II glutamine amidotransferase [Symbiopectobacterium sp.]